VVSAALILSGPFSPRLFLIRSCWVRCSLRLFWL
jgi:hypothetical protein